MDRAEAVAAEVRDLGRKADVFAVNIVNGWSREAFAKECFDSGPVDAIVNNAGADLLTGELKDADFATKLKVLLDVDVTGSIDLS